MFGVTGAVTIDRSGQVYVGFGPNVGKALTGISGSATAGWLNQAATPNPQQLQGFLSGHGFNAGGGYWVGGGVTYSPGTGGTATNLGFFSPQIGAGYTYSWQVR